MKTLKQLSKFFIVLFISITFSKSAISNEPVDIWKIEKKKDANEEKLIQAYKECGTDNETTTKNHKLQSNINIKNRANYV